MTHTPTLSTQAAVDVALQHAIPSIYPATIQSTPKVQHLLSNWAISTADRSIATSQLLAHGINSETWHELLQLQEAVRQRLQQQQQNWWQGWAAWAQQCTQIKNANTMSKLVEQEFNLIGQIVQLVSAQATSLATLQETIEVDYGYWVHEKIKARADSAAAA